MYEQDVKTRIIERLNQLNMSMAFLSVSIGRNRAYIQQFLKRNTPKRLNQELLLKIANLLQLAPSDLGLATAGMKVFWSGKPDLVTNKKNRISTRPLVKHSAGATKLDNAVSRPDTNNPELITGLNIDLFPDATIERESKDILQSHEYFRYFRMLTNSLERHEVSVAPGDILVVDTRSKKKQQVTTEQIVVLEFKSLIGERSVWENGFLVREFVQPSMVKTNSWNEPQIIDIAKRYTDYAIKLIGIVNYKLRRADLVPKLANAHP